MRFLTILFRCICTLSIYHLATLSDAEAWPRGIAAPHLEIRDQLLSSSAGPASTMVRMQSVFGTNYTLAVNSQPLVFSESAQGPRLADGSLVLASGRFDRDGIVDATITLPATQSGRWYLQLHVTRRGLGRNDQNLSLVRVVADLDTLAESLVITGAQGPAGPVGPQGAVGPVGPQGEQGPVGPMGPKGDVGPAGPQGVAGPQGEQGPAGPIGPQGEMGAVGPQGVPGEQGPVGPMGPKGDVGPVGPQGVAGPQGEQGPAGPMGPQGEMGAVGPQGAPGEQGSVGPMGPQGEQGPIGPRGPAGEVGPIGPQGAQGLPGAEGPTGPQGPVGPQGPAGPQGERGLTGPQGLPGEKGEQGPPGETPQLSCPQGWLDLGPTCMQPFFTSQGTIEQALNDCYSKGARICEHQDLAFACSNRAGLNIAFPDATWLLTGSVMLRTIGSSSSYVAYTVYRRVGDRCFGPSTVNPTDGVVNYELSNAVRNYTCCSDRTF